mmetsp:Transcript_24345/g.37231  ORF Transcript_24345/g.37231 Transcript_24345/m.37231 type:complete len:97 (-) Transcript_24345:262-552(-)
MHHYIFHVTHKMFWTKYTYSTPLQILVKNRFPRRFVSQSLSVVQNVDFKMLYESSNSAIRPQTTNTVFFREAPFSNNAPPGPPLPGIKSAPIACCT